MKHLTLFVLVLICGWFGYSCLDYRTDQAIIAQVGEAQLSLDDLRRHWEDSNFTVEQAHFGISRWVDMQVLYEEAIAQGLHNDSGVQHLLQDAQVKILTDQLWLRILAETPEPATGELLEYYQNHSEKFLRLEAAYEVGLLMHANGKEIWEMRDRIAKTSFTAVLEKHLAVDSTRGSLPAAPVLLADIPGCFQTDLPTVREGGTLNPRKCGDDYGMLYLSRRHQAGEVLPFEQVRGRIGRIVHRENAQERLQNLLVMAKSRHAVFTYPERLGSLPVAGSPRDTSAPDSLEVAP